MIPLTSLILVLPARSAPLPLPRAYHTTKPASRDIYNDPCAYEDSDGLQSSACLWRMHFEEAELDKVRGLAEGSATRAIGDLRADGDR